MRAGWRATLKASKDEAILAADLYNQSTQSRRVEAFFVHMHLAWLYLFIGKYQRDRHDYHYRLLNGRFVRIAGEPKTFELAKFVEAHWRDANDPVRRNLELTIALRNKIEHRYSEAVAAATAGYAQSLLMNYEHELTEIFGEDHSLGSHLRFPVFIGILSKQGVMRAASTQALPRQTKRFIDDYESALDPAIRLDQRYEFRVHLIPKLGSKTDADMAMTFVRLEELTDEQRNALTDLGRTGTVVVREQIRDVANADKMKPGEVSRRIEERIPFKFSVFSHFQRAWRKLDARPNRGTAHPERTKSDFCVYDKPHNDYLYTESFVDKVVRECSTKEGFEGFTGLPARTKIR